MTDLRDPRWMEPLPTFPLGDLAPAILLFVACLIFVLAAFDPAGRIQEGCLGTVLLIASMLALAAGMVVLANAS